MKTTFTILIILVCSILFFGCAKTVDTVEAPEAKVSRLLTGIGNRYWHLSKIYVNNIQQTLSDAQMKYTKTYTIDPTKQNAGKFTNSDGLSGTWAITGSINYIESFVSGGGAGLQVNYLILDISENTLDVQYSANNKLVREVYYAY